MWLGCGICGHEATCECLISLPSLYLFLVLPSSHVEPPSEKTLTNASKPQPCIKRTHRHRKQSALPGSRSPGHHRLFRQPLPIMYVNHAYACLDLHGFCLTLPLSFLNDVLTVTARRGSRRRQDHGCLDPPQEGYPSTRIPSVRIHLRDG